MSGSQPLAVQLRVEAAESPNRALARLRGELELRILSLAAESQVSSTASIRIIIRKLVEGNHLGPATATAVVSLLSASSREVERTEKQRRFEAARIVDAGISLIRGLDEASRRRREDNSPVALLTPAFRAAVANEPEAWKSEWVLRHFVHFLQDQRSAANAWRERTRDRLLIEYLSEVSDRAQEFEWQFLGGLTSRNVAYTPTEAPAWAETTAFLSGSASDEDKIRRVLADEGLEPSFAALEQAFDENNYEPDVAASLTRYMERERQSHSRSKLRVILESRGAREVA